MNTYQSCADCNTPDPSWASINRGVLLCNDCCSVHRVMGTHVSHVRALSSHNWPPAQKEMVFGLVQKGANTLWEHQLHDPHSKSKTKKPTPRDKIHPTKHDFIISKYKHLAFLPRVKDNFNSIVDMSKQLHASVRTSNLETCLRLVSLGADPNYMHADRGNTPLHVAAQAGQAMQVELLVVNGADPSRLDRLGHTPEECARIAGHHQLADRLVECQYELTDKLSNFVSGRKPVHNTGEHFLVPLGSSTSPGMQDARSRLQEISNDLFEELAADVYDEVDRRETDSLWLTTQQLHSSIAFLPVNPTLSPLRNQGRQKLATLNAQDFAQLIIDILLDTKRRQAQSVQTGEKSGTVVPTSGEDKSALYDPHDYDEVPMDEARPPLPPPPPISPTHAIKTVPSPTRRERPLPPNPPISDGMYSQVDEDTVGEFRIDDYAELKDPPPRQSITQTGISSEGVRSGSVSRAKFDLVKDKLKQVQEENDQLQATNQKLQSKLDELQQQLNKVIEENVRLRSAQHQQQRSPTTPTSPLPVPATVPEEPEEEEFAPMEVYAQVDKSMKTSRSSTGSYSGSRSSISDHQNALSSSSPQATPLPLEDVNSILAKKMIRDVVITPPLRQDTPLSDSPFEDAASEAAPLQLPSLDSVHAHIKVITQCIQDLLKAAQSHQHTSFGAFSSKTSNAVRTLTKLFPQGVCSQTIVASLREVGNSMQRLQESCAQPPAGGHADLAYRRSIIALAYDVAKACRHLVMCAEQE